MNYQNLSDVDLHDQIALLQTLVNGLTAAQLHEDRCKEGYWQQLRGFSGRERLRRAYDEAWDALDAAHRECRRRAATANRVRRAGPSP